MIFEWDENKRLKTLRDRGIDFVDMAKIWNDSNRQERVDRRFNYREKRIQTIGTFVFDIFFIVYTERGYENGEEIIRIISARRANKKERDLYLSNTFKFSEAI
jgi:uncharacterized protein